MQQNNNDIQNIGEDEISLKELILKIKGWYRFLLTKWLVIVAAGIIGGAIGVGYAYTQKANYTATLSFVLEGENTDGTSGALGLASSFGIDIGGRAGSAFSGANLFQLMQSRSIIEKALLNPITVNGKTQSFAQYFIEINKIEFQESEFKTLLFDIDPDRSKFTLQQNIILENIYSSVLQMLTVGMNDKQGSIISIKLKSIDEHFSKAFAENLAYEVSSYYIEIKSKRCCFCRR
jgi:uncharacterized protein involved in exopolysaccharide biosynthesis